jgi:hypothetical protein
MSIIVTGTPSFSWASAKDKVIPPIIDPFFKENQKSMRSINKNYPILLKQLSALLIAQNQTEDID